MGDIFVTLNGRLIEEIRKRTDYCYATYQDLLTEEISEAGDVYGDSVFRRLNEMQALALLSHIGNGPMISLIEVAKLCSDRSEWIPY